MESNSKEVISWLNECIENDCWDAFPSLCKIRQLGESFHACAWFWVPRSANEAADYEVSHCGVEMHDLVWVDRPPSLLMRILNKDGLPRPHS